MAPNNSIHNTRPPQDLNTSTLNTPVDDTVILNVHMDTVMDDIFTLNALMESPPSDTDIPPPYTLPITASTATTLTADILPPNYFPTTAPTATTPTASISAANTFITNTFTADNTPAPATKCSTCARRTTPSDPRCKLHYPYNQPAKNMGGGNRRRNMRTSRDEDVIFDTTDESWDVVGGPLDKDGTAKAASPVTKSNNKDWPEFEHVDNDVGWEKVSRRIPHDTHANPLKRRGTTVVVVGGFSPGVDYSVPNSPKAAGVVAVSAVLDETKLTPSVFMPPPPEGTKKPPRK